MSTGRKDTEHAVPRMPHERDQSSDSQQGEPREVMEKAYRDIEEGRQDTDRRGIRGYEKPENRLSKEKVKGGEAKEEQARGQRVRRDR